MKMVYTHENRLFVANARNLLEAAGIEIMVKNEHAASAIGEISAFDSWVELWVLNSDDYDNACSIIDTALSNKNAPPWVCSNCHEENDTSFELCWNCSNDVNQV